MKKTLLVITAGALSCTVALSAATPEIYLHMYSTGVSPDGKYASSSVYGAFDIINLETGEKISAPYEMSGGQGSHFSNTGILVGSTDMDLPIIYRNGEFEVFTFEGSEKYPMIFMNAITPDGTRLAGDVTGTGELMLVPCYWQLDAKGEATEFHILPHPEKDFLGNVPQYITAISMSEDGKTILGQIVDNTGGFCEAIVYSQDAAGEWSYELPTRHLLNPDNVVVPEIPEAPEYVNYTDFMTEENKAAYDQAYQEYIESFYDPELLPDPADYMTAEQVAAYNAAVDVYNEAATIFNEKLDEYNEAMDKLRENTTYFIFNSLSLSPDGKSFAAGAELPGETFWDPSVSYTVSVDLAAENDIKIYGKDNTVYPVQMLANGVVLGTNAVAMGATPPQAYIKLPENEEYISLYDYFKTVDTEVADWMDENLMKEITLYDPETYEPYQSNYMFSGLALASLDGSTFFCGVQSFYWEEAPEDAEFLSYAVKTAPVTGLDKVSLGNSAVKILAGRGGILHIAGDATSVAVYDLTGRMVYTGAAASTVNTGLGTGAYIVKVSTATGSQTAKVRF